MNIIVLDVMFPVMALSVAIVMEHNRKSFLWVYASCYLDIDQLESF